MSELDVKPAAKRKLKETMQIGQTDKKVKDTTNSPQGDTAILNKDVVREWIDVSGRKRVMYGKVVDQLTEPCGSVEALVRYSPLSISYAQDTIPGWEIVDNGIIVSYGLFVLTIQLIFKKYQKKIKERSSGEVLSGASK